jgi:exonuclease SbcC
VLPKYLHVHDFASYHDAEIDFLDLHLAAIIGENGAGKSSSLAAIRVALFGSAEGSLDGFVRQGAPGFRIQFTFEAGGHEYMVIREYGREHKASLSETGAPVCDAKVRDVDAAITRILGCDYDGFTLAHWLPQGRLGEFSAMDPARRKEWLMGNLPMQEWKTLEDVAKTLAASALDSVRLDEAREFDLRRRGAAVAEKREHKATLEADRPAAAEAVETAEVAEFEAVVLREKLAGLRSAMAAAHDTDTRTHDAMLAMERKVTEIERAAVPAAGEIEDEDVIQRDIDAARERTERLEAASREWSAYDAENDRLRKAALDAEQVRHNAEANLTAFDAQEAPICPACGQEVRGEHHDNARKMLTDLLTKATDASDVANTALRTLATPSVALPTTAEVQESRNEAQRGAERLQRAKSQRDANARREKMLAELDGAKATLTERTEEWKVARAAFEEADRAFHSAQIGMVLTEPGVLESLRRELAAIDRDIAVVTADLKAAEADLKAADDLEAGLAEGRDRADLLTLLAKAYGKSGIPARMIEGAVAQIETFANEFLGRFTDGLTLELRTQRETKTAGNIRETLDILVSDAAGTRPIENYSGGERTRVNFALAVGLSTFLSVHHAGRVESFTVDEPDFLDAAGTAELVRCLHYLAESVPLVMVVSHNETVADGMPQRIVVRKGVEGSRMEVTA